MGKAIKKLVRYIFILAGILLAIPLLLYVVLQIPAVQTRIVNKITAKLSGDLQSTITIGRVDYHFFNKLALRQVLFLDRNNDTLIYAERLAAGIRRLDFKGRNISLGRVDLFKPEMALITDSSGLMNLSWYLRMLNTKNDSTGSDLNLTIDRVDLENGSFKLINHSSKGNNPKIKFDPDSMLVSGLNGTVEDFSISNDTTAFSLYNLTFVEKSGFRITRMSGDITVSGTDIFLNSASIYCDTSILNITRLGILADSSAYFRDFVNKVRLNLELEKSVIHTADLAYFAPLPEGLRESVTLEGRFSGTVAELRGRDVNISYGARTFLDCDFDISGLPQINDAFIYLGFNKLRTNVTDLGNIRLRDGEKLALPDFLYKIGDISFDGSFSGFITDFVTYGQFSTAHGEIRTDISLRPEKNKTYRIRGLVNGHNIDLNELTGSDMLGKLTLRANVDGYAFSTKKFAGNLTGMIDSVGINNYNYRNVDIKGEFTETTWDGSISIDEKNIKLDLLGMFNFNDTLPEFDFTLNLPHANLHDLNIDKKDSTATLSMLLTSNFKGSSIDNLDGEIKLLNSELVRKGKTMDLYDFSIRTFSENNRPVLSLRTDFVDAVIRGNYNFEGLKHFARMTMSTLMPSLSGPEAEDEEINHNDFTFEVNFRNTDKINDFFNTGILLAEKSYIRGFVSPDTVMNIEGKAGFLSIRNIRFNDFALQAGTSGSKFNADLTTSSLGFPGNTQLGNFKIEVSTLPDTFKITADWDNHENIINNGIVKATGSVRRSSAGSGKTALKIDIDSSSVFARNNHWKIDRSSVEIDSSAIAIKDIHVSSEGRFYHANGEISEDPSDTLHLEFMGIDISPFNHILLAGKDTTGLKLDLKGMINGNIAVTGVYDNLLLESDIILNDFSILGGQYGDVSVNSEFDRVSRVVDITAGNNLDGVKMFDVSGIYDPRVKELDLDFTANRLPVDALNPLLRSFASDISGYATGRLKLAGATNNLVLLGAVKTDNVKMKINYLQTTYTLNDSIRFNRQGFRFTNVRFTDEEGRVANISGMVNHRNLRNYTADLVINMSNNFLVMNTEFKDNPSFYGRVSAAGVTRIKAAPDLLSFDISARTGNNTRFFIPLTDEMSVTEYSFVTFIDPESEDHEHTRAQSQAPKQLGIDLKIDLTVTPDAVAELIFDEKVGDKITGSGSGLLNIAMNPKGDFKIVGDYTIEKGDYLFTLGNIVNKRFQVENGGRISFNGDLADAEIELKAIYQKFNTSLFPVTQDADDENLRFAVEPQLLLSGKLFNPTVKFEINLPNTDEQARTRLRNAIASDEVLSRQFMYLLVTNSFYAEQNSSASTSGTSAMAATTFEMISNQLSNWISQINDNFNLGLNYRPGSGSRMDPDEVQVAFETQVLDDRVVLNGNFDYRTTTTNQLTGDFEAEVRITDKVRFKVFNRFNDTYLGRGPYTQGIGIFFREDFEKISDLFRKKKENSNAKKEEEVTVMDQ